MLKWIGLIVALTAAFARAEGAAEVQVIGAPKAAKPAAFSVQTVLTQIEQRRIERLKNVPVVAAPQSAGAQPIDAFVAAKWPAGTAPQLCDDSTFLRRVYLDVIGVIPSAEEARAFAADSRANKRALMIDTLLQRDEEYAAHWIPFWEEALAGTPAGGNGLAARNIYSAWLADGFKKNKPFDIFAAELLLGDLEPNAKKKEEVGENDPRAKELNAAKTGALPKGYVRNRNHADTMQTAANVGQVFLGTAIKCATCHNHFDNPEWKLETVTAFASLFAPKDLEMVRCENRKNVFVPAKFLFPNAEPATFKENDLGARVTHAALSLTDPQNPRFAKAIVNRLWKRYMGLGLVEPVDDFRADRTASHPELLNWLADDFLRHNCDLKHTIRTILNSRTYQLSFKEELRDHFDSAKPDAPRLFRSPALRRLTAEQAIDSARMAGQQKLELAQRTYRLKDSSALTRALGRPPYVSAVTTSRPNDVAIVQMLELLNGREFGVLSAQGKLIAELQKLKDESARVDALYWSVLSRAPRAEEKTACEEFLRAEGTLADLMWALLGSPEFHYLQ